MIWNIYRKWTRDIVCTLIKRSLITRNYVLLKEIDIFLQIRKRDYLRNQQATLTVWVIAIGRIFPYILWKAYLSWATRTNCSSSVRWANIKHSKLEIKSILDQRIFFFRFFALCFEFHSTLGYWISNLLTQTFQNDSSCF